MVQTLPVRRPRLILAGAVCCALLFDGGSSFAQILQTQSLLMRLRTADASPGPGTLERVNYALELAQLGAENDMQDLSLTAVQRALGSGPPISVENISGPSALAATSGGLILTSPQGNADSGYENVLREIETRVSVLSELWKEHDFPPGRVYETLRSVVLPPKRDGEIFLYARPVLMQQSRGAVYAELGGPISALEGGSVGQLLAEWAAASGHADDLRSEVEKHANNPRSRRQATVLLGQLAIAESDGEELRSRLEELDSYLSQDTTQTAAELACHVALPALSVPEAREAALPLLTRVVDNVAPRISSEGTNIESLATILRTCSRACFDLGDAEQGRRMLDKFLDVHQVTNRQYSGDYPLFLRKQQLGVVAFELLRAGDVAGGLSRLGERDDIRTTRNYGTVSDAGLAGVLALGLSRVSADERYSMLLEFTFPEGRSNQFRVVTEFLPMDSPPPVFIDASGTGNGAGHLGAAGVGGDMLSTAVLLIDTARELGRLDEVIARLGPLAENNVAPAADFLLLANLADGRTAGVRERVIALTSEVQAAANQDDDRPPYPMFTHLFAARTGELQSLAQPTAGLFTQLLNFTKKTYNDPLRSHTRWAHANTVRNRNGSTSSNLFQTCTPEFWNPAGYGTSSEHAAGTVPNIWFAQTGMINHVCGPHDANLFFRYPLTGDFDFSVNAQDGAYGEGNISFGGVSVEIQGWGRTTKVYPDGRMRESERHPMPWIRSGSGAFNRHSVQVRDGVATFRVNGYRIYEDRSSSDPWLALHGDWGRNPVFSDLKLTGNPVIPREVALLADEQLRGWIAGFYRETQPNLLATVQTAAGNPVIADGEEQPPTGEWDWSFRGGALHGRKFAASTVQHLQSRFYYHRPLQNGDVVRYEFFYEPGESEVFPALGRLAFLIQPDGVSLHWMTDGDVDVTGLSADNRAVAPEEQIGSPPLSLRSGEWNDAGLELRDGIVRISLNGAAVYEHVLDPQNDRLFGFFHYKDQTEARVRNAVLSGDWPREVPAALLADLTSTRRLARSQADGRALGTLIGEQFAALDAYSVYQQALRMPPEERFAFLADWVMPGRNHSLIRCYAATTPTHPAEPVARANPVDVAQLEERLRYQSRRIEIGGNLVAPVLELVSVAAQSNRLDELYDLAEGMPLYGVNHVRSRLALLALIALERREPERARTWLIELYAQLRTMDDFTMFHRWPSVVAASRAVLYDETRDVAIEMMEQIEDAQMRNGHPADENFNSQVRRIRSLGWALREGVASGQFGGAPLDQWDGGPLARASSRGAGRATTHWQYRSGQLLRYSRHEFDALYFAVPLAGNYEVDCQLTSFGWRETNLAVAGLFTAPVYTHDRYAVGFVRFRRPDVPIDPKLNALSPWFNYRVTVREGVHTSFVEGRELHQEQLPAHPDPWLSVMAGEWYQGGVRRLRITGSPEIPEKIPLLSHTDLSQWVFDYYDESVTGDEPDWRFEEGALIGRVRPVQAGMNVESVIRYHRPLLEDGEVEYEFQYQPGSVACHPALDRLVFLLREDGVQEHWLTDGMHDRTGLRPDNHSVEPDFRRGPDRLPLIENDWNSLLLAVSGDTVRLTLNGALIYERPIAPTNLRVFGLFHYTSDEELRARNIVHRGEWPRALPPLDEQQLAVNPTDLLALRDDEAPAAWEADFSNADYDRGMLRVEGMELGALIEPANDGLRMRLPAGEPAPRIIGAGPDFGLRGDFQVDTTFDGLEITPPAEAWGAGIEVSVRFADDYDSRIQFERRQFPNQDHSLATAFHGRFADGTPRWFKRDFWMWDRSGTMRIVRRGEMTSFLFALEGSDDFQLLDEFHTGAKDVRGVFIRAAASDQVAGTQAVWKSMRVRADAFLESSEVAVSPRQQLDFDLSREPIGGTWLLVPEPGGERYVRRTHEGIVQQTPSGQGGGFGVTLASRNYRLGGDFEVTADFELIALAAPDTGYGAGIQLRLTLDDPRRTLLHHGRRAYADRPPAFAAHYVRQDADGKRLDDAEFLLSDAMTGRLRLRREGGMVIWEVAPADSDEFQILSSAEAGNADVRAVDLLCESSHTPSGRVQVAWKRLQIRADRIQ